MVQFAATCSSPLLPLVFFGAEHASSSLGRPFSYDLEHEISLADDPITPPPFVPFR